jgi:nucleotide-binding universal stress UspA family protein
MFKRVVIPLDGSKVAEGILPFIMEIAGPLDFEVVLLRILEPIPPTVIEGSHRVEVEDVEARMAEAHAYLRAIASGLTERGVRVRTAVRRGVPIVNEILEEAKEAGADLVAMTTHGRSGLSRLLFGSVAEALLRQSDIPVFLMRLTEKQVAAGIGAA